MNVKLLYDEQYSMTNNMTTMNVKLLYDENKTEMECKQDSPLSQIKRTF